MSATEPRTWQPIEEPPADLRMVQILMADGCWSFPIARDEGNPHWWWHGAARKTWAELRAHQLREVTR